MLQDVKQVNMRINKAWLILSEPTQIVKNRIKKRSKDAIMYFQPIYTKYQFNEEGS